MVLLLPALLLALTVCVLADPARRRAPIVLSSSGGFSIGGKVLTSPFNPNETLSCDHGYVEYFHPVHPRQTSLVFWHSSSTQAFQNRWDGGEGYKDIFLRRRFPVYLWEGPGVGRANWGCKPYMYIPSYRDRGNFVAWNLGPAPGVWWNDSQFPQHNREGFWADATRARYVEFDTAENVQLHSDVAATAVDSGRLGDSVVLVTNSAGGIRGLLTAIKSTTKRVKAVVMYEIAGSVLPDTAGVPAKQNGFGPFVVPLEEYKKLAELEMVQFVWGDHRSPEELKNMERYVGNWTEFVENSRISSRIINELGGRSEVFFLGDDAGLKGSSHVAFMDMDNVKVANLLEGVLERVGLAAYEESGWWPRWRL